MMTPLASLSLAVLAVPLQRAGELHYQMSNSAVSSELARGATVLRRSARCPLELAFPVFGAQLQRVAFTG